MLDISTIRNDQLHEQKDSVEHGVHLVVVGGKVDPLFQRFICCGSPLPRRKFCVNQVGVVRGVETDDKGSDAIARQQALGSRQSNAQKARVHFRDAGLDDADDLNIDAVKCSVGGHGKQGQAVANLYIH